MRNYYPELVQHTYVQTSITLIDIEAILKVLPYTASIKAAAYTMVRFESANGKKGINHNYIGLQTDSGRWPPYVNKLLTGYVVRRENGTNLVRYFAAFDSAQQCLKLLCEIVLNRGLYIGGTTGLVAKMRITDPHSWAIAYKKEWVTGKADWTAKTEQDKDALKAIASTLRQGLTIFDTSLRSTGGESTK